MTLSPKARAAFAGHLRHAMKGNVLSDDFSRGRYATDASPFQSFPVAIALPKTQDDILAAMQVAWEGGVPIIARGGGTGRAGQAIGAGLVIDTSKYLTRLLYYDASAQTCIVEPGITPAALNEALKPERMWFPVEIGASLQATVGGMAATDALGRRTLLYGRMRNNISACDVVLADGREISLGEVAQDFAERGAKSEEAALILDLLETAENSEDLIRALPSVPGCQNGFNLQALLPGSPTQNLASFLAGSEGTLAVLRRLELKLARQPALGALGVCHLPTLGDALRAVQPIIGLEPTDIELTSRRILELGVSGRNGADPAQRLLRRDANFLLIVEFMAGNRVENARKLKELAEVMATLGHPRTVSELLGPAAQEAARRAHRRGLDRLYGMSSRPAEFAAIDQFALPLEQLASAAEEIAAIAGRAGLGVTWHGQVGVGALFLRPWSPMDGDGQDLRAAAKDVHAIFDRFAGSLSSVEGYGIARSFDAEITRDPKLTALLEAIKTRFDPGNRLNPGKIVLSAKPGPDLLQRDPSPDALSKLAALNCNGTGLCRRLDKSVMCPSFQVTREERDSPRGRANTLRLALAGELGPDAMASDSMNDAMSLCVSCKACRSECPRAVDIAQAKIAVQEERVRRHGLSKFATSLAFLPRTAPALRPWRHLLNLRDLLPWTARLSERLTGLSADRPWPRWSAAAFSGRHRLDGGKRPDVVLFPDTFNNYFDPVTLRSAFDVLEASGFRVQVLTPPEGERPYCCGRTFLEAGLTEEARVEARRLIAAVSPYIEQRIPFIGLEPACALTIRDEFVNTLREDGANELAAATGLFEEIMSQDMIASSIRPRLLRIEAEALCAAHCHQQAFGTARLARRVAALVPGINVIEADRACCGMGTSFGYRPDAVSTSFRMGELSLFPQIRRASPDTLVVADGFACRKQINDGTGRTARHTAVLLKLALAAKEKFGHDLDDDFKKDSRRTKRLSRLRRHYFK
jgi:FAD/FMN-containing dehydrogenase/Fe-S oxidoreductase